jgi:Fur family ferric uptake transcriptional regulator
MVKSKEESIKNILKSNDLKATDSRMELLSVLFDTKKPMTLKEIMLKMGDGGAHEVTMYRMLSSFKDLGVVKQVDFQDSVPYFELADDNHDHHHIVCTSCKKISDFVGCGSDDLIKKALSQAKDFASINSHSFELFGTCKKCSK